MSSLTSKVILTRRETELGEKSGECVPGERVSAFKKVGQRSPQMMESTLGNTSKNKTNRTPLKKMVKIGQRSQFRHLLHFSSLRLKSTLYNVVLLEN